MVSNRTVNKLLFQFRRSKICYNDNCAGHCKNKEIQEILTGGCNSFRPTNGFCRRIECNHEYCNMYKRTCILEFRISFREVNYF